VNREADVVKTVDGLEHLDKPLAQSVLTIGNFDGVHLAHQQLLAQAGLFAANTGGPVVVLTFEPHPLSVVTPKKAPERLTPPDEKFRLLSQAGADLVVVAKSEPKLLGIEAERFVDEIIWEKFHPTQIVEGPSFGFGRARRGTPELLKQRAAMHGCETHILQPVTLEIAAHETLLVSSTVIRGLIRDGKVRRAALCLGRPYALLGTVVRGCERGTGIGFPTANLEPQSQLVPGEGVYSGAATVGDATHPCAISIGHTPTFDGRTQQIEAHLLDFSGDLYGQPMRLEFHRYLRGQQKFESTDELVAQLQRDVAGIRRDAEGSGLPGSAAGESMR